MVPKLVEQGHKVRALVHRSRIGLKGLDIEIIKGSLSDIDSLNELARGADVLIHLAAYISLTRNKVEENKCLEINVAGTRNVLEAARIQRVPRVIHTSSVHAALAKGPSYAVDHKTQLNLGPGVDHYSRTKALAEQEAIKAFKQGREIVIVRPTAVIGPKDYRPSDLGLFIDDFLKRKVPALVTGGFDFVDARDVSKGIILAAEKGRPGQPYFLSGRYATVRELAEILEQSSGVKKPAFTFPGRVAKMATPLASVYYDLTGKRPRFTRYSIEHLEKGSRVDRSLSERHLGYTPRPLEDTIADTVRWFGSGEFNRED
ncbi:MAG: NAD-dependent epimerase/dehydratase family protein [Deltaproteobacteria bacterium]|nr:NAD-dependent epimerase/dehydratase family protein [Deltaproteobacteria bacterium]